MDYKKLLKKAREALPEVALEKERFEIPKIRGHLQGNKTVLSNFMQIANTLRRTPQHMLKYILKELATPGEIKKSGVVMVGSKTSASRINEKIRKYTDEFVLCPKCGKPDTKIIKESQINLLKCQACGAKCPIKSKI
jgi:translation initiation factor 2 subunit 2